MNKAHSPINWENYPKETTPINEENLNKMDVAIGVIDDRVITHENEKATKTEVSPLISNVEYDEETSLMTITRKNGEIITADLSAVSAKEAYTKEQSDQKYANAIKRTYSGETIVATDSSNVHFEGMRVFGRSEQESTTGAQLFDASKLPTKTQSGATVTNNGDGSFTVSGSGALTAGYALYHRYSHEETLKMLKAGEITLKGSMTYPWCYAQLYVNDAVVLSVSTQIRDKDTNTILQEYLDNETCKLVVGFYGASGSTIVSGTIKPMLYQDGDGTWESYSGGYASPSSDWQQPIVSVGDDGTIEHGVYGKNLLPFPYHDTNRTVNGITHTVLDGGGIKSEGVTTIGTNFMFVHNKQYVILPKGKYRLCNIGNLQGMKLLGWLYTIDGKYKRIGTLASNESVEFEVTDDGYNIVELHTNTASTGVVVSGTIYPLLIRAEIGDISYEPYTKQSLTIQTPNGLPAIQVTDASLATYTDENGVMWCADEVNYGRGKYVQRVHTETFEGSDDEGWADRTDNYSNKSGNQRRYSIALPSNIYGGSVVGMSNIGFVGIIGSVAVYTDNGFSLYYLADSDSRFAYITIENDEVTNLDTFKTWLSNNPVTAQYILAEPIETDLTAEEIEAYKALVSNYPTTTILNDENAFTEATLVADTQNHIEQNYVSKESYDSLNERLLAVEEALLSEV